MIYESMALTNDSWDDAGADLVADGWEFVSEAHGVVYLRRPFNKETD